MGSLQPRVKVAPAVEAILRDAGNEASGFPRAFTYRELACAVYSVEKPSAAQTSAVRRAVARLVSAGRAERLTADRWANGLAHEQDHHWRTRGQWRFTYRNPSGVLVRRPMTSADHERREKVARPYIERAEAKRRATPYPVDTGSGIQAVPVEPVLVITEHGVRLRTSQEPGSGP